MPVVVCLSVTILIVVTFFRTVDLRPQVDESFFFSKHDPQLKADNDILKTFPEWRQIVLLARGDIRSPAYQERVRGLSDALAKLPGVASIASLSRGPKDLDDALKSPLWSRLLITRDQKSTYLFVSLTKDAGESTIGKAEALEHRFESPAFRLTMSGVPYMTELIARNLGRDLRVFSLAAVCIFGVLLLVVFRSAWILLGTFAACADSGACTLLATHLLHIPIGPLTANLSTIVFVMTLSPIVFLSFNWKRIRKDGEGEGGSAAWDAVKQTVAPSFWSATCMFLGFISLRLVPSTPMKHLGTAGAIGATLAFASAYLVYPWFLEKAGGTRPGARRSSNIESQVGSFFSRRHGLIVAGLAGCTVIGAFGLPRLNTDPDLPSYFKQGGDIRTGLEFVDQAGGSSPLKLVVEDKSRAPLNHKDAYKKLWNLQEALARDPAVGNVMSVALLLSEPERHWYSFLFSTEKEIKHLEKPEYGEIAGQFISPDRTRALFLLRMRETRRDAPRKEVIERLEKIVGREGFHTVLVGGAYSLLDQMARLVSSSIISGVLLLIAVFTGMGLALSRSFRVAAAMLVSLSIIPVVVLGCIAYLGMPLDSITASAANLDLGLGVDAMIYLTVFAKRRGEVGEWGSWSESCSHLWRPIGTSLLVICCGFSIFLLSSFPPTQRFGLFVMFGSATAATAALFLFPWLASLSVRKKTSVPIRKAA